ncbi:MAG: aminoglycoside phosphotransferase family protein [Oscillospiraceae bacterium]|nr:aminoglycoside phosphotransferase family protein [Oscillospiraceae bacterium]
MKSTTDEMIQETLAAYDFGGQIVGTVRYGEGHINDTFCVYTQQPDGDCKRFILQRINTDTFNNPRQLMENISGVTTYLRSHIQQNGGDTLRETLNVLPTKEGAAYYTDTQTGAWRVYLFVEGTVCLQKVENEADFYTVAQTFGNFQNMLADYPADTLHETIAAFHDTPNRYENFEKAVQADVLGRAKGVQAEIDFVRARKADCRVLKDLLQTGKLPLRVTHNDTKLNNVLIDKTTGKGICVIDLDTVMPGLSLHDFGDSIRFGANNCAEDEPDTAKVSFSLPLFETFTKGFLNAAGDALTKVEKEYLPWGAKLMTLECGMRFLTDYLEGDHYFRIHRDGQNVDRCRTQFKLVQDMETNWQQLNDIIKKYSC